MPLFATEIYLVKPTPYSWTARSSYFRITDLAGFPKDEYYVYQSGFTKTPVLDSKFCWIRAGNYYC